VLIERTSVIGKYLADMCVLCPAPPHLGLSARLISLYFQQCVARKVPELCKGYTPGKSENDLHMRIARLEQIIEVALPQYAAMSPRADTMLMMGEHPESRSRSSTPDDDMKGSDAHEPSGGILQSGKFYGTSALGSVSSAAILEPVSGPFYVYYSPES